MCKYPIPNGDLHYILNASNNDKPFGTVVELVGHCNPFVQFVVVNQQLVMIICGSTSMLAFRTITVTEKYGYSRQLPRKMKKFVQKHTD